MVDLGSIPRVECDSCDVLQSRERERESARLERFQYVYVKLDVMEFDTSKK
jgi:hypothetical protein